MNTDCVSNIHSILIKMNILPQKQIIIFKFLRNVMYLIGPFVQVMKWFLI